MVAQLEAGQRDLHYAFHLVDVDCDPALAARYGLKIPVLAAGEREICHYVLDRAALSRYLQGR